MRSKNSNQITVINSLRGIAALSVVLYHFICTTVDYIHNEVLLETFHYGVKGVQLFFVISGIVIPLSMINNGYTIKKWWNFIVRRFIRIEPPYFAAILLGIIYLIGRNYIPGTAEVDLTPSVSTILLHLGYLIPFIEDVDWINPVFWTLAVEFQYYLAISLLLPLALSKKIPLRYLFYAIFIGVTFLPIASAFFPFWGAYFMVGISYTLFIKEYIKLPEYIGLSAVLVGVIWWHQGTVDLIVAILAMSAVLFIPNLKTKPTLFLGKISYSLYLVHTIVGAAFINYLSHQFRDPFEKFLVISGGVVVSIIAAYLMYRFVEKPTHEYAKRLKH
ncbi:MAG: acyltransferase [Crocinitomicaceae bacterium]|nr:acyltransferase [Crocinitomicaceae bacterium]